MSAKRLKMGQKRDGWGTGARWIYYFTSIEIVTSLRETVLFVNRRAGTGTSRALVAELERYLCREGYQVTVIDRIAELTPHVSARKSKIRAVVAVGGDGTVKTAVNTVGTQVPIAVFPVGTENLLAKHLGMEADPRRVADTIIRGKTKHFDVGRADGKLFLQVLSCGFDAEVIRRVHARRDGNITHLAYAWPILESIWAYDFPAVQVELEMEGGWQSIDCHWAFVFNTPSYAAGLQIVQDANPADGSFEVATFAGGSVWRGLRYFWAVVRGQHQQLPDYRQSGASRIRLTSRREGVPYQIDGDPGGCLPVEIEVLKNHLQLIVDDESG